MKKLKSGVLNMLTVFNRYKVFFIILMFAILAALVWLFISMQNNVRVPSKGIFVINHIEESIWTEGGRL